jgi:hypothetical protein
MVEFALALPVFLLLVFGAIEFGRLFRRPAKRPATVLRWGSAPMV